VVGRAPGRQPIAGQRDIDSGLLIDRDHSDA